VCATQPTRRPRVLLGNLAPMTRLGMARLLADRGVDVTEESRASELPVAAAAIAPDAIVLPMDEGAATEVGRAQAAAPDAKLILWARDESEMHVYDAGRSVPRRVLAGMPGALLSELENDQRPRGGN
jgi:DNA-binding NarL/FixJ family response regulator